MRRRSFTTLSLAVLVLFSLGMKSEVFAVDFPKPGNKDLCPVCGMLVSKYPNWTALAIYKDGHAHYFDGAKDMFKYLGDLKKYAPKHRPEDIAGLWVTEFYGLSKIDARKALYVIGSDTLGPMGHEFVPLETQADAEEFLKEHKGKRIVSFEQISAELASALDKGKFD
ncbi:MAG: nitrous oxide reductase accessory protein NosL [Candidatus Accumulibacter sp.]|nr:nitrous oxide reductase accessory protein NosL [Accumulibacter sp.]